jgi:hypothetical protein
MIDLLRGTGEWAACDPRRYPGMRMARAESFPADYGDRPRAFSPSDGPVE